MAIPKDDIKLGFWIGVGFLILGLVLALARALLAKVTGGARG